MEKIVVGLECEDEWFHKLTETEIANLMYYEAEELVRQEEALWNECWI